MYKVVRQKKKRFGVHCISMPYTCIWFHFYSIGMTEADDWRKCDAVAKVISCCPLQTISVEEYYRNISPQVVITSNMYATEYLLKFLMLAPIKIIFH